MECEHLVALLTELNESTRDTEGLRTAGIEAQSEPISSRVVPVLDAIATILVRDAKGEIIACALQLDQDRRETIITLASNGSIPIATKTHLESVWKQLQSIAEAYNRHRLLSKGQDYVKNAEKLSSKSSEMGGNPIEIQTQIRSLEAQVYLFSMEKFAKRILKPLKKQTRFDKFSDIVDQYRHDDEFDKVIPHLVVIRRGIRWVAQTIRDRVDFVGVTLDKLLDVMYITQKHVKELLESQELLSELEAFGLRGGFPIVRYLKKIISLQNAADNLCGFAHSARLRQRHLANTTLRINLITTDPRPIDLPRSLEEWKEVADNAAQRQEWKIPIDLKNQPGHTLIKRFNDRKHTFAPVHCECAIALHFLKRKQSGPHPIGYIGVSKLSCLACWNFLRSLEKIGFNMISSGTHSKAYFPWKYPDVEVTGEPAATQEEILKAFISFLSNAYVDRLQVEHAKRTLSDSLAASAGSKTNSSKTDHVKHNPEEWDSD